MAVNIEKQLQPSAVGRDVASLANRFQTGRHHMSEDHSLHNRYVVWDYKMYVIAGFHDGMNDIVALQWCHATFFGRYRRLETTCRPLEEGTDRLFWNVGHYKSSLCDITENRVSNY